MSIKHLLPSAAFIVWGLSPVSSWADTVVMRSGEHLGGKIIHKSGDTLILQTDYAGEIHIQWSKVVAVTTDSPVAVQLEGDEAPVSIKLDAQEVRQGEPAAGAQPAAEGAAAIPLAHVVYINPLPEETSTGVNYKGRANFSYSKTGGNSSHNALYAETDFAARAKDYRFEVNAKANRSQDAGVLTNSNWLVGGNYDRFLDPRHFLYGRTSVEHDRFKGIDQRDMIGGGYGLQLLDTPQTQLSVRSGLDYVMIDHVDNRDERYPSLGWGVKFAHKLESYRAEVFHEQEGFWNLTDARQVTLRTRSGLRIPLMAGLTATSQLNVDWEHRPDPGRKATDSMLLFGLGYEW